MREKETIITLFEKDFSKSKKLKISYVKGYRKAKIFLEGEQGALHGEIELEAKELVAAVVNLEMLQ